MSDSTRYHGPAFFSYGFRPFFLSAALFAGLAIPAWVFILTSVTDLDFLYAPRDWHVHEMVFGFLPCVITGFLLTALPNWTDRPPLRGLPLISLLSVWLMGRLAMAMPGIPTLAAVILDGVFLILLAGIVWREIILGSAWDRLPMGIVISLYAGANVFFHTLLLNKAEIDMATRMALSLIMILLALIGGRITPSFTEDFLDQEGITRQPAPFSRFDGLSIAFVGIAAIAWTIHPEATGTGSAMVAAGLINLVRLGRWQGHTTWREPLVLILHIGYGWVGMSLLILGGAILGVGLSTENAVHALTTGAVGAMTLAVMTRASLGHTGRTKHAGPLTVLIYLFVNIGAILRVFGQSLYPSDIMLTLSAICWSGAYILFAVVYSPILLGPNIDD
ncbi:MAG: NnrS family protein [Nitrospirales bacterium]